MAGPGPAAADAAAGYRFAVMNAVISGFAVSINAAGVRLFADSTLYTTLKNGVVGLALLIPFAVAVSWRRELAGLGRREWCLLALIALVAGSAGYALQFRGLQISTAPTAALVYHAQVLVVAALAAVWLGERFRPAVWAALPVLAGGLCLGLPWGAVRWDAGVPLLLAGMLLFAAGAILIKVALRTVSLGVVVAGKMTLGAVFLFAYTAASGRLGAAAGLSRLQWEYVAVTGLILLAFTLTEVAGLRHASATGVTAVSAGAPVITTLLFLATRGAAAPLKPEELLGTGLALAAVLVVFVLGRRDEGAARRLGQAPRGA